MSTGGGAVARRGRVAWGVVACLLLAACGSDTDSDLVERVSELEQENESLRAQLAARDTTPSTEQGGTPVDSAEPTTPTTPEIPATLPTTTLAPALGTRENPRPLGEPVPAGDWTYTVLAFEPNVDSLVAGLSANNEPAGEGKVYSRLRLKAEYNGRGAGDPHRLSINLVSPVGTIIGDVSPCCEPQRDLLTDQPEIFAGASVEGWFYYPVTAVDLFMGSFVAFDPGADQTNVPGGIVFFVVS